MEKLKERARRVASRYPETRERVRRYTSLMEAGDIPPVALKEELSIIESYASGRGERGLE